MASVEASTPGRPTERERPRAALDGENQGSKQIAGAAERTHFAEPARTEMLCLTLGPCQDPTKIRWPITLGRACASALDFVSGNPLDAGRDHA